MIRLNAQTFGWGSEAAGMENADHAPEKAEGLSGTRPSLNPQDSRLAVDEREYLFSADDLRSREVLWAYEPFPQWIGTIS
jgi:hypothetical protein